MERSRQGCNYPHIVEPLMNWFGNCVSREAVIMIVDQCGGSMSESINIIKNMTSRSFSQTLNQPSTSYAMASQNTGAIPKQISNTVNANFTPVMNGWTTQLKEIMSNYSNHYRVLIIMRGAPGSGKSYLAKQIVELTVGGDANNYSKHICSTDDFFMNGTHYAYDRNQLHEAHSWNQIRAGRLMKNGECLIIVDNTNIHVWEMEPYVRAGVRNGYIIEIVEPNTPWAVNPIQLSKKNKHNVPVNTIRRMLDTYERISGEEIIKFYNLSYSSDMKPPVTGLIKSVECKEMESGRNDCQFSNDLKSLKNNPVKNSSENLKCKTEQKTIKCENVTEIQKDFDQYLQIEQAWEDSENWDDKNISINNDKRNVKYKEEKNTVEHTSHETNLTTFKDCEDWTKISIFMSPWDSQPLRNSEKKTSDIIVETASSGTCMEMGDTEISNMKHTHKVISATPRDINFFYIPPVKTKIPEKVMLDKSSMTNEQLIMGVYECKNKEQHFVAFRKLFRNIAKTNLRDIFDKCGGDVNWAVDIVIDGMENNELVATDSEDLSDTEDFVLEQCNCLAAYDIIPDRESIILEVENKKEKLSNTNIESKIEKKGKKDKMLPETFMEIKHHIEQSVVIPDNHYSEHCLKIKKIRRGEQDGNGCVEQIEHIKDTASIITEDNQTDVNTSSQDNQDSYKSDSENSTSSSDSSLQSGEKMVNINLGRHFISQLDKLFGRNDKTYPEYVIPKASIPLSLLNEINALWMESLMYQIEAHQSAKLLQQDEEFARQLAEKEEILAHAGKEPEVPNFKEIMDLDFALALYQKDVEECRNKQPDDLATKMTKEKLYNLFPDVCQDTLSEMYKAHDYNFEATVAVLLNSTGQEHIVDEDNGVNKFIFKKEMERQKKVLEEEEKALSQVSWSLFPGKQENIEMDDVNNYRELADKHLEQRNDNLRKAQDYMKRGLTEVASYYSSVAEFHKQKYEQNNSLAAASLIQVNAINCHDNNTIDLHYLRVREAKESLDLFIDTHIQQLREEEKRGPSGYRELFFITGRGLHSTGKARLKPAVKQRLQQRGFTYMIRNPGLLSAKVYAVDKLTHQIT